MADKKSLAGGVRSEMKWSVILAAQVASEALKTSEAADWREREQWDQAAICTLDVGADFMEHSLWPS